MEVIGALGAKEGVNAGRLHSAYVPWSPHIMLDAEVKWDEARKNRAWSRVAARRAHENWLKGYNMKQKEPEPIEFEPQEGISRPQL